MEIFLGKLELVMQKKDINKIDDLAFFKENGYLVKKKLIPINVIEKVLRSINNIVMDQLKILKLDSSDKLDSNLKNLFNNDLNVYKKTLSNIWRLQSISFLLGIEKLTNYVKKTFNFKDIILPGGHVFHLQSKSLKIPGGYFGFDAHQDYNSVNGSLDGLILWIPLNKVDNYNYPIEFIPKSHKNGLLSTIKDKKNNIILDPSHYKDKDFISVDLDAGDIIFLSYFTIHRSKNSGRETNVRYSLSTRFDNSSESSFKKRIYPTAYVRSVDRNIIKDSMPNLSDIKKIFD